LRGLEFWGDAEGYGSYTLKGTDRLCGCRLVELACFGILVWEYSSHRPEFCRSIIFCEAAHGTEGRPGMVGAGWAGRSFFERLKE